MDLQVQSTLKWLWGRTKAPVNMINTLTTVNLTGTTVQYCQDLPKAPLLSPTSACNLKLARDSMMHLEQ